jgi:hypothetical protein
MLLEKEEVDEEDNLTEAPSRTCDLMNQHLRDRRLHCHVSLIQNPLRVFDRIQEPNLHLHVCKIQSLTSLYSTSRRLARKENFPTRYKAMRIVSASSKSLADLLGRSVNPRDSNSPNPPCCRHDGKANFHRQRSTRQRVDVELPPRVVISIVHGLSCWGLTNISKLVFAMECG